MPNPKNSKSQSTKRKTEKNAKHGFFRTQCDIAGVEVVAVPAAAAAAAAAVAAVVVRAMYLPLDPSLPPSPSSSTAVVSYRHFCSRLHIAAVACFCQVRPVELRAARQFKFQFPVSTLVCSCAKSFHTPSRVIPFRWSINY